MTRPDPNASEDPTERADDPESHVSGLIGKHDEPDGDRPSGADAPGDGGSQTGKAIDPDS